MANALNSCTQKRYNGSSGYLATITSSREFDFLVTNSLVDNSSNMTWISGSWTSDTTLLLMFLYGPEYLQPMYDPLADRAYSFHKFDASGPDIYNVDDGIVVMGDGTNIFYRTRSAGVMSYVCEYSGSNQPFITSAPTIGGVVILSLQGYSSISNLQLTFTSMSRSTYSFQCIGTPSSMNCTVPQSTGEFRVSINAPANKNFNFLWSYQPPYISSVYPSRTQSQLLTITGGNFGSDSSLIQVSVSDSNVACLSPSLLVPHQVITCQLSIDIPTIPILPITIYVDGVSSQSFKSPMYYNETKVFYSAIGGLYQIATLQYFLSIFSNDGVPGYPSYLDSVKLYDSFSTFVPTLRESRVWDLWLPVTYIGSSKYGIIFGPFEGKIVSNIYTSQTPNTSGFTSSDVYSYVLSNSTIQKRSDTYYANLLIQYGGIGPRFIQNTTTLLPLGGGSITTNLTHLGPRYQTNITVNMGGCPGGGYAAFFDKRTIVINAGASIPGDGPYSIIVYVNGLSTLPSYQIIKYMDPTISSISTVPLSGGSLVLSGNNFGVNPSNTSVSCQTTVVNPIPTSLSMTSMSILVGPGTGYHNLTVRAGKSVLNLVFNYDPPTLLSYSLLGTNLTTSGTNFGTNSSVIVLLLDGVPCVNTTLIGSNKASCILPQGSRGGQFSLTVNVSRVPSTNSLTIVDSPLISMPPKLPRTNGDTMHILAMLETIDGNGTLVDNEFYYQFGNITVVASCTSTGPSGSVTLVCQVPPITVGGNFKFYVLSPSAGTSNILSIPYHSPIINGATPVKYLVGGEITVIGESFGLNQQLFVSISNSSLTLDCTNVQLIDPTHITCLYPGTIPPNVDGSSLFVNVSSFGQSTKTQAFLYSRMNQTCQNNCSNHGVCNYDSGDCVCDPNWTVSTDCSIPVNTIPIKPPTTDGNGTTTLPSKVNFTVAISHIREIGLDGVPLKTLDLKDIKWSSQDLSTTLKYYNGSFDNGDSVSVQVYTSYYNESETIQFAGESLTVPSNSIKYQITISNWTWISLTSSLEIIYHSQNKPLDSCNSASISTNQGDSVYWYQIKTGDSILNAKFSSRMIVDDRIIRSNVRTLDPSDPLYSQYTQQQEQHSFNIFTAIKSPSFLSYITIDPSFSSLITSDPVNQCNPSSNTQKIIIISVCSGVAGVAIVAGASIWFKKHQTILNSNRRLKRLNVK